jgi:2-dehydropantoate 2-reductase
MKFLFFGAGAIGTYLGGSLALAGNPVAFVERPEPAATLRRNGLRLTIGKKTNTIAAPDVYTSAEEALEGNRYDLIVFALKSYDTDAAVKTLLPLTGRLPAALCLQNGVENESCLEQAFGRGQVIAGTVTSAVGRGEVGEIRLERNRGVGVALGHPLSLGTAQAFWNAGIRSSLFENAYAMKWSKMLTNLPSNASSAILEMTPAEVYRHPGLFRIEREMLRECLRVMHAYRLPATNLPGTPVALLAFAAKFLPVRLVQPLMLRAVGGGRGGKMPSLFLDMQSGRGKSEVGWLNGAVTRFGEPAHIATPVNRVLTETLEGMMNGVIDRALYRRNPDALLARIAEAAA